jgi:hypothetical protein
MDMRLTHIHGYRGWKKGEQKRIINTIIQSKKELDVHVQSLNFDEKEQTSFFIVSTFVIKFHEIFGVRH